MRFYFGNKEDLFYSEKYLESKEAFDRLRIKLNAKSLTFLKQVHGSAGHIVQNPKTLSIQELDGDFLITNKPGSAIGVLTADCLPIILYDYHSNACGIIHAGWRGSVGEISANAVKAMVDNFGTQPENLQIYFGPSAKVCCYEVSCDFQKNLPLNYQNNVFKFIDSRFLFDNVLLNKLQLLEIGALVINMNFYYNACTICDLSYHSYRRMGLLAGRQASVVVL